MLLRSAGVEPWYIRLFARGGFECRRVAVRERGVCMDRVNMYASTWVCVKREERNVGAESEGKGVAGGRHMSARAYATEAVWLWQKGGGRRWKAG